MKIGHLSLLCTAALCITLTLGLWPFYVPRNDVAWLPGADGLAFGKHGTAFASAPSVCLRSRKHAGGSVEAWVQPSDWSGLATILSLYRPDLGILFTLRRSLTDVEPYIELQDDGKTRKTHFYVDEAFARARRYKSPLFITVTSGRLGAKAYLDGALTKAAPQFRIPEDVFTGRLIAGDSPWQPDSFQGQIRGLAVYRAQLNAAQVLRHYQSWTQTGRPAVTPEDDAVAVYLFDEMSGNTIHNRAGSGGDLYIPQPYQVVDKEVFEPFWKEFEFSRNYWKANLKNVVGFMPLGFCFYAWLMMARLSRKAMPITVALGFLVSLAIEWGQAFLPTRDSGTTDLITNTLGTYLGVLCYRNFYPAVAEKLPLLRWFAAPRSQPTEARPESSSKRPTHCSS